ncbi:MAG: Hsp20/alpha crystallin family protein [Patescibacteria group bacterium]
MNLIKWNNFNNQFPRFPSIFDEFFGNDYIQNMSPRFSKPAVNIKEEDDQYLITLGIPGVAKDDCTIEVEDGMLHISCTQETENTPDESEKYSRYEYNYASFNQSFSIPDNVDIEAISGKHENGELQIILPKTSKVEKNRKLIDIS